jgi:hypothetical protein
MPVTNAVEGGAATRLTVDVCVVTLTNTKHATRHGTAAI